MGLALVMAQGTTPTPANRSASIVYADDDDTPAPTATLTYLPSATRTPAPTATLTYLPTATRTPANRSVSIVYADDDDTPAPTATLTYLPTATDTPAPTATLTPVPPTNTPVTGTATTRIMLTSSPSNTPTAMGTGSPPPKRTPAIGSMPPPNPPAPPLHVRVLSPLVQPGAAAPVAVSYVANALVQAVVHVPGRHPVALVATTDSHGHVRLVVRVPRHVPLHRGRAVAHLVVRATSGRWYSLATRAVLVGPGATWHIAGSYTPQTPVRVLVTFPGVRPVRLLAVTDSQGHFRLTVRVPRNVTSQGGHALAQVAISALAATRHAQVRRILNISDMVVSVVGRPIVHCLQPLMLHVAYHPNVRLRIVLLFPNHQHPVLPVHTDQHGIVTVHLALHYVQAPNPLRIGVKAIDTSVRPPRLERVTFAMALPPACRSAARGSNGP